MSSVHCMHHLFRTKIHKIDILRLKHLSQQCVQPAPKEVKRRKTHMKEIEKYMSSNEHVKQIKDDIPVRLLRKNRKAPDDLYLVDAAVAADVAASLKPYILSGNKTILETNPGFGFITRELLDYGVKRMQLYESTVCFRDHILVSK